MYRQHSLLLVFPLLFTLGVLFLLFDETTFEQEIQNSTVNRVIGNESYLSTFGEYPDEDVPEQLRIKTHLQYVEEILRNRPVDHLSEEQKENRAMHLEHLTEYILAGEFPRNDGHPDTRRPTFISEDGNICAVGYLIERSLGWEAAESINEKYKYEYIQEINDPVLNEWLESSGFSLQELAMIQPAYEPVVTDEVERNSYRIGHSYGIGSLLLTSANALYLSNNSADPWLFDHSTTSHWFGLAAGSGSVLLGALNLNNSYSYTEPIHSGGCAGISCPSPLREVTITNHSRTALSIANMGVGLFSVIRSGYHLVKKTEDKSSKTSLGVTQLEPDPILKSGELIPAAQLLVRF